MTPEYLKETSGPLHTMASREADRRTLANFVASFLAAGGYVQQIDGYAPAVTTINDRHALPSLSKEAVAKRRAQRELEKAVEPIIARLRHQNVEITARYLRSLGYRLKSEQVEQIAARLRIALPEPAKPAGNRRRAA